MTPADDIEPDDAPTPGAGEQPPVAFNMHDHKAVQDRSRAVKQKGERADLALKTLMQHADGRLLIWDMLSDCGVFSSSYRGEATHASAFTEGERNVGLKLFLRLMKLCPDHYATMQKENGK